MFGALQPTRIVDVPPADPALLHSPAVAAARALGAQGHGRWRRRCDRGIEGSGFVYAKDRVMTNAHVVAGASRCRCRATTGWLRGHRRALRPGPRRRGAAVPGLTGRPLPLSNPTPRSGQDAIVLGYPQDGPFDVRPARVRDRERDRRPRHLRPAVGRPGHLHDPVGGARRQLRRPADRHRRRGARAWCSPRRWTRPTPASC